MDALRNEGGEEAATPEAPSVSDAPRGSPMAAPDAKARLKAIYEDPRENEGLGEHGCQHYRRRCRIRAPCCGATFDCRHCHNDHQAEKVDDEHHELPRHQVDMVICSLCETEQKVQQFCAKCGVCMGQYFCSICKFFDDDTSKQQFHCGDCGICRVGGRDKFFHCRPCGCCYSVALRDNHRCVEKSMNHNCPICFEYLFDSLLPTAVLDNCGHTLHSSCLTQLLKQKHMFPACPMCSKSIGDCSDMWAAVDIEVASTPMPPEYQNKEVSVLCNDCGHSSMVLFHIVGLKCKTCGSYNTRQ